MQVDFKKKALLEWAKPYLARSGENSKTGIIIIDIVTTIIITTVMIAKHPKYGGFTYKVRSNGSFSKK